MGRAESVTVRSSFPLPASNSPSVFDKFARVLCSIWAGATQYRGAPFSEKEGRLSCLPAFMKIISQVKEHDERGEDRRRTLSAAL